MSALKLLNIRQAAVEDVLKPLRRGMIQGLSPPLLLLQELAWSLCSTAASSTFVEVVGIKSPLEGSMKFMSSWRAAGKRLWDGLQTNLPPPPPQESKNQQRDVKGVGFCFSYYRHLWLLPQYQSHTDNRMQTLIWEYKK